MNAQTPVLCFGIPGPLRGTIFRSEHGIYRCQASENSDRGAMGDVEESPSDRLRHLHGTHSVWKFGPRWYLPLAILPFLVSW